MNRRDFLARSSLAAAAGLFIDPAELLATGQRQPTAPKTPVPRAPEPAPQSSSSRWAAPFDSAPTLQAPTTDGVTIVVAVKTMCTCWVEYGPTRDLGSRADASRHGLLPLSDRVHAIPITGLSPGATCFYRVVAAPIDFKNAYKIERSAPVASEVYSFRTLDGGRSSAARFSLINDTHEKVDTLAAVTSLMAQMPADLTFWNGDIFDDIRSDEQIVRNVLRPAGAAYAAGTPMCFVGGNHDVRGVHARNLDRFAPVPDNRRFGLFRHGPIAFVVLDTGEDKPDTHPVYAGLGEFARYRETQKRWLAEALKSDVWRSAPFRIGVLHIPLWGKGASEDSRIKWHPLLAEGKTQLVLNGHIHEHLYTPPNDDHAYGQLVAGGPKIEAATFIHAAADEKKLGVLVFDAAGKEIGNHEFNAG